MKFSLIICTYQRPKPLIELLTSVQQQSLYPNEVLIIDGSIDNRTKQVLEKNFYKNLKYFLVDAATRGLTKQRNFGISKVSNEIDIVCFLDDDTILDKGYFKELINTYHIRKDAIAVGGYITNEVFWQKQIKNIKYNEYELDGFVRKLGQRNVIRKRLGLLSDKLPGVMPKFSNGFSVSFLPPSNKIYELEFFMGGVSSYKKEIFSKIFFSTYFDGYGLYEDLDFCLRIGSLGKLYINTNAQLAHHHNSLGRPNKFTYGKMVVRNGWYVWRVKYSRPSIKARFNWNVIVLLLTIIRFSNIFTSKKRVEAFTESMGRIVAWISLFLDKPKIQ